MLPGTMVMLLFIVICVFGGAATLVTFNIKSAERRARLAAEEPQAEE